MQLGLGFWGSKTLLSAVELGLFTELAKGPLDAGSLRDRLRLHSRSHIDFLDALVALGMLTRNGGSYANTAEADLFLDRGKQRVRHEDGHPLGLQLRRRHVRLRLVAEAGDHHQGRLA